MENTYGHHGVGTFNVQMEKLG